MSIFFLVSCCLSWVNQQRPWHHASFVIFLLSFCFLIILNKIHPLSQSSWKSILMFLYFLFHLFMFFPLLFPGLSQHLPKYDLRCSVYPFVFGHSIQAWMFSCSKFSGYVVKLPWRQETPLLFCSLLIHVIKLSSSGSI